MTGLALNVGLYGGNPSLYGGNVGIYGGAPSLINPNNFYDPAAQALFARMTTPPTAARAALINSTIVALKAAGLWTKLEVLYFLAAADAQASKLNWISASFNATAVNSPTFTADRGYAGDSTTSYLNTNWIANNSSIFLLNSASFGCWLNAGTTTASNAIYSMGALEGVTARNLLRPRSVGDIIGGSVNCASVTSYVGNTATTTFGFTALSRTGSAASSGYRNNTAGTNNVVLSAARNTIAFFLGGYNSAGALTQGTDNRMALGFMGAGMTDADMLNLYNIANTYLTAVGGQ